MDRTEIRYEPLWAFIYWTIVIGLISSLLAFDKAHVIAPFVIFLAVILTLVLIQLRLRKRIIAVFSKEGLEIPEVVVIQWEKIEHWEYWSGSRFSNNKLVIYSDEKQYSFTGFNPFKVLKLIKKYAPNKNTDVYGNALLYSASFFFIFIFIVLIVMDLFK